MPSLRIYTANSHENKRDQILTGSVSGRLLLLFASSVLILKHWNEMTIDTTIDALQSFFDDAINRPSGHQIVQHRTATVLYSDSASS